MLQNIFYIIFILSTFTLYSNGYSISEYSDRELLLSMNSQLSELKEALTNDIAKNLDMQFIRAEIERQKKCVLDKEADYESLIAKVRVNKTDKPNIRVELQKQKEHLLEKEAAIQSLRVDNHVLGQELEQQKKFLIEKDAVILANESAIKALVDILELYKNKAEPQESDKPHNCTKAKTNGVYDILVPKYSNQTFKAACDVETRGGGWTILMRKMDEGVNFYRNWTEYKNGFGNVDGNYFLGLDRIHAMTAERPQELLMMVTNLDGDDGTLIIYEFAIADESQQYELQVVDEQNNYKFTTYDRDNDKWSDGNCAIFNKKAWWYNDERCCLDKKSDFNSFKRIIMMIRPKE